MHLRFMASAIALRKVALSAILSGGTRVPAGSMFLLPVVVKYRVNVLAVTHLCTNVVNRVVSRSRWLRLMVIGYEYSIPKCRSTGFCL